MDEPSAPVRKWDGHSDCVEQIQWDPSKRFLASCGNDAFVNIWSPEKNKPEMQLPIPSESAVMTIKWGNKTVGEDLSCLAAGCKEGLIYIFNVK